MVACRTVTASDEVRILYPVPTREIDMKEEELEKIEREFWEWFDSLPLERKEKFWYWPDDMARFFFIWQRKKSN